LLHEHGDVIREEITTIKMIGVNESLFIKGPTFDQQVKRSDMTVTYIYFKEGRLCIVKEK